MFLFLFYSEAGWWIKENFHRYLGTGGMIGGHVVDIESEVKKVERKTVEYGNAAIYL